MKNLTDRQINLIIDLLNTYQFFCTECEFVMEEDRCDFQFEGKTYKIAETDYKIVCEIIDYIKGVKK